MPGVDQAIRQWLPSWLPSWRRQRRAPQRTEAAANTVSMADVADEAFAVEVCDRAQAHFADGIRRARRKNPFRGWSAPAVTLRGYRLRDVVLDRSLMVLLKNGRVIAETNYLQSPESIAAARVRPETLLRPAIGRTVATCFDHWDVNYYHWLAHTVPTVHALMQRHPHGDVGLVVPRLSDWQQASLARLGAASLPTIATDVGWQYWLPEVEYYDYVAGRADYCVSGLSRAAYARIDAGTPAGSARRLYIDRRSTTNRRIPNEAALVEALIRRGFEAVRPELLSLEAQIALFKGAGLVVGQLGAGLANIAFCQPGAVVYELVPEHHRNPCFLAMCMQGNLDYWGDVFPTGVGGDSHTGDWQREIDIDHVQRRLDELEAVMPADRRD